MSEPFIGEVKIFAGNFAIRGWAFCNGQLLPINQNQALFSLLGTTYGGNGQVNFALPNLQGRAAMSFGNGPGLTPRQQGEQVGEATHTLTTAEMPAHTHLLRAAQGGASTGTPGSTVALDTPATAKIYRPASNLVQMGAGLSAGGGGQGHENRQPFLALNFLIALVGIFPSRN